MDNFNKYRNILYYPKKYQNISDVIVLTQIYYLKFCSIIIIVICWGVLFLFIYIILFLFFFHLFFFFIYLYFSQENNFY